MRRTVALVHHGGSTATTAGPYAGQDRRLGRTTARDSITTNELTAFGAALALIGLGLPTLLDSLPHSTALHAQGALRTTWSILFVCAGLFRLVRWRLTGEACAAFLGVGMVAFGLLSASTRALAPLLPHETTDLWLSPVTRTIAVAVFQVVLARGLLSPRVDARVRPTRMLVRAVFAGTAVLALIAIVDRLVTHVTLAPHTWFDLGAIQAGAWLFLAAAAAHRGARYSDPSTVWISFGLLLMWIAEMLHAMAFVSPSASAFYATCLQVVAGAVALANSATDLGLVFSEDGNRLLSLSGALHHAETMLTEEERLQAERLHDARSVIAALKAASITLDRYDERLETEVKHRLRSSLVSELARLERVIAGRREEPLRAFRLQPALQPLLIAEHENGMSIHADLSDFAVIGRPLELATVVQNLLVNARRHAPGSPVRITATHLHGQTRITVEDRGPGVDPSQRELVFARGHRGNSEGSGSGLGLYLARRLMREQGGEISVRDRVGGGASFVLTLPAPSWNQKVDDGIEVLDAGDSQRGVAAGQRYPSLLAGLPRQRHDDASCEGGRPGIGHDQVDQRSLIRRADVEAT